MNLHHVGICVKDMEKSIEFYQGALGLTLFQDEIISGPEVDAGLMEKDALVRMVILLDEAGNMIELLGWQSQEAREKPPEHNRFTSIGIVEVCLMVSDLDEAEKKLKEKGYGFRNPLWTFGKDIESYGGGYAKIRYVEDPNGIQVELMEIVAPPPSE
jgi:catechol 2,3-dioxygenase-like lactoylglutathione lyase family enzyme